jgi:hypothetical protein
MEQFMRAVLAAGQPDVATVLGIAARNGIEMLGPVRS